MLFEEVSDDHESPLGLDQAYLTVKSSATDQLGLYHLHDDCHKCPYTLAGALEAGGNATYRVDARRGWTLALMPVQDKYVTSLSAGAELCHLHAPLGDRGMFELNVTQAGCSIHTMAEPQDIFTPLWTFGVLLAILAVVHGLGSWAVGWFHGRRQDRVTFGDDLPASVLEQGEDKDKPKSKRKRLATLDTFRGITIMLMIFVNEWDGQYWFFSHAVWNGLLVADLVFPWFLWIMGVCIPLSLASNIRKGRSTRRICFHIIKRSVWLFLIGIVLNSLGGKIDLLTYRIPGVLQRFSITYLVIAMITLPAMLRHPRAPDEDGWQSSIADITNILPQWLVVAALVIVHTVITFALPVPGCPTGYLGPGGLYDNATVAGTCIGGAAGYIDRITLGLQHLYQNPTAKQVYQSAAFDPEGVLGSLTSCLTVFLGVQAGMTLYLYRTWKQRIVRWMSWCVVTGTFGAILCFGYQEGGVIPINKNLWSLSYTLVTACFAFFLLSFCYMLVDMLKWWSGSPFIYPGRNALAMYVGHMVAYNVFPFHWKYGNMSGHAWKLGEALWGLACWMVIAIWMHEKKYFWKL